MADVTELGWTCTMCGEVFPASEEHFDMQPDPAEQSGDPEVEALWGPGGDRLCKRCLDHLVRGADES